MKKTGDDTENKRVIRGGFQPKKTEKSEAENPPTGGSKVNKSESPQEEKKS